MFSFSSVAGRIYEAGQKIVGVDSIKSTRKRNDESIDKNDDTMKVHFHEISDIFEQGFEPSNSELSCENNEKLGSESSKDPKEPKFSMSDTIEGWNSSIIVEILRTGLDLEIADDLPPKSTWLKESVQYGTGRNGGIFVNEVAPPFDHDLISNLSGPVAVKIISLRDDINTMQNLIKSERKTAADILQQNWKAVFFQEVIDGAVEDNADSYEDIRSVWHELEVLQRFKTSEYFVNFQLAFFEGDSINICLETCKCDLQKIASNNIDLESLQAIAEAALRGLEALHSENIVHFDIKPSNILIDDSGRIKLCDFDSSTIFDEDCAKCSESYGPTRIYTSPETAAYYCDWYSEKSLSKLFTVQTSVANDVGKADIWSLALTLLEVYTGTTPFTFMTGCDAGDEEIQAVLVKFYAYYSKLPDHENVNHPRSLYTYMETKDYENRKMLPACEYHSPTTMLFYKNLRARLDKKVMNEVRIYESYGHGIVFDRRFSTFQDFMTRCLAFNRSYRPSAWQALKHPMFHGYKEDEGRGIIKDLLRETEGLVSIPGSDGDESITLQNEVDRETDRLTRYLKNAKYEEIMENPGISRKSEATVGDEADRVDQLIEFYDMIGQGRKKKPEAFAKKVLLNFPGGILVLTVALYKKYGCIPRGWETLKSQAIKLGLIEGNTNEI